MIDWILSPGVLTAAGAAVLTALWRGFLVPYLTKKAEAAGALAAQAKLEEKRGEVARLIEDHKAGLNQQAESLKAKFQKELTDYAIYVQRRHDAVRDIYAAVIKWRNQINGSPGTIPPGVDHHTYLAEQARLAVYALRDAHNDVLLYLPDEVNKQVVEVINCFIAILIKREEGRLSLEMQAETTNLYLSIIDLANECKRELQSSVRP